MTTREDAHGPDYSTPVFLLPQLCNSTLASVQSFGEAVNKQGALPEPAATILSSHAFMAVLFAAIQDAGILDVSTPGELRKLREEEIISLDSRIAPLLDRVDELVLHLTRRIHRAYVEAGVEPIAVDVPSLREAIQVPITYLDDYIDLVERLRANPTIARDLLQTAELMCFEFFLQGSAWKAPAFAHLFTPEHKGFLLVVYRCLGEIAGQQVTSYISRIHDLPSTSGLKTVPDRGKSYPMNVDFRTKNEGENL